MAHPPIRVPLVRNVAGDWLPRVAFVGTIVAWSTALAATRWNSSVLWQGFWGLLWTALWVSLQEGLLGVWARAVGAPRVVPRAGYALGVAMLGAGAWYVGFRTHSEAPLLAGWMGWAAGSLWDVRGAIAATWRDRRFGPVLVCLTGVGVVLRLFFLVGVPYPILEADTLTYTYASFRALEDLTVYTTLYRGPTYTVFAWGTMKGLFPSYLAILVVQHILGVVLSLLTYGMARRVTGGNRYLSLVVFALVLFSPTLLWSEHAVLSDALCAVLLVWTAWIVSRRGRPRARTALIVGLVLVATKLLRNVGPHVEIALVTWACLASLPRLRRAVPFVAILLLTIFGGLSTWKAHNLTHHGAWTVNCQGGWHLFGEFGHMIDFDSPKHQEVKDEIRDSMERINRDVLSKNSAKYYHLGRNWPIRGWVRPESSPGKRLELFFWNRQIPSTTQQKILKDLALEALWTHPGLYAAHVRYFFEAVAIRGANRNYMYWKNPKEWPRHFRTVEEIHDQLDFQGLPYEISGPWVVLTARIRHSLPDFGIVFSCLPAFRWRLIGFLGALLYAGFGFVRSRSSRDLALRWFFAILGVGYPLGIVLAAQPWDRYFGAIDPFLFLCTAGALRDLALERRCRRLIAMSLVFGAIGAGVGYVLSQVLGHPNNPPLGMAVPYYVRLCNYGIQGIAVGGLALVGMATPFVAGYIRRGLGPERVAGMRAWREKHVHWIPLVVALLPSLLLFVFPIYEEDPPVHVLGPPWYAWTWLQGGRLIWWPIYDGLRAVIPHLPGAAYVLALFYTSILTAFLLLLYRFLSDLLGGRLRGAMATALIAMHFFFYEARIWNGHGMLTAMALTLVGLLLADRLMRRGPRWGLALGGGVFALFVFLALNTHQAGVMVALPLVALRTARDILDGRPTRRVWRYPVTMGVGFALACGAYGTQMFVSMAHVGASDRFGGRDIVAAARHFLELTPRWVVAPLPLWAKLRRLIVYSALLTLAAIVLWITRRVPLRRRLAAGTLILLASLASYAPAVLTDGFASVRVLTPALVGIWGGIFLFVSRGRPERYRRVAWIALCALFALHLWGFGLLVAIKSTDKDWTRRLHRELAANGIAPGSTVWFHTVTYPPETITWADLGRSLYDTRWGQEWMIRRATFSHPDPLPADLKPNYAPYAQIPPETPRPWETGMVNRRDNGDAVVWCPMVSAHVFALEQRFLRPWDATVAYPVAHLWEWGAQEVSGNAAGSRDGSRLWVRLAPEARWRVWFRAVELTGPWRSRIRATLKGGPGTCVVRFGIREADGSERVLDSERIFSSHGSARLRNKGDASPGAVAWLEIQSESRYTCKMRIRGDGLILE